MTQLKSKKKIDKNDSSFMLRSKWTELSPNEQDYITNFFALHNAAQSFYGLLSEAGQNYVNYCINLSVDLKKTEKKNESAQV